MHIYTTVKCSGQILCLNLNTHIARIDEDLPFHDVHENAQAFSQQFKYRISLLVQLNQSALKEFHCGAAVCFCCQRVSIVDLHAVPCSRLIEKNACSIYSQGPNA